jgi:hypothetical protein
MNGITQKLKAEVDELTFDGEHDIDAQTLLKLI